MPNFDETAERSRPSRQPSLLQRAALYAWRTLAVVLLTALVFSVFVVALCGVLTLGPSERARELFVLSVTESSALKFVPHIYLSDETVESILHPVREETSADSFQELGYENAPDATPVEENDGELVKIDEEHLSDELEIIEIRKPTFKGKLMIIHDPSRVIVGTLDRYGGSGWYLKEFVSNYNAIAGTNAGSFEDPDGQGTGGIPDGLVMRDGRIDYGSAGTVYSGVIGFDANHILHVGTMSGQEALNLGLVTAVSFPPGPTLIKDGVKLQNLGGGYNPRTCVGQRADGAVLLVVIEGRHPDSIGATYDDLADLMEEYGAVNAGNLDGGSSSAMIYNGEQITKGSNLIGSRPICTAILVLGEGEKTDG